MSEQESSRHGSAAAPAGGRWRRVAEPVRAGDDVHVSGQVPPVDGEVVTGGIVAQTEQIMANVIKARDLSGCEVEDVVTVNCRLDDVRDVPSSKTPFARHFGANPPARPTVEFRLMVDATVEIDMLARKPL